MDRLVIDAPPGGNDPTAPSLESLEDFWVHGQRRLIASRYSNRASLNAFSSSADH
jgi:hypothetical protein